MSSVSSRIVIESYYVGGFGVFIDDNKEIMGLDRINTVNEVIRWLNLEYKKNR